MTDFLDELKAKVEAATSGCEMRVQMMSGEHDLYRAAVNLARRLTSEEGVEAMARALTEHAFRQRRLTLMTREWAELREGCMDGMRSALNALLSDSQP